MASNITPFDAYLFQDLHIDPSKWNVDALFINAQANREAGGGANNPLNTTTKLPGSTPLAGNPAGVQNYTSISQGALATAQTLLAGTPGHPGIDYYPDIRNALLSGTASLTATYKGLATWSGGGYSSLAGQSTTPGANNPVTGVGPSASSGYVVKHWPGITAQVAKFAELTTQEKQTLLQWLASGQYPQGGSNIVAKLNPQHKNLWDAWVASSQGDVGQAIPQGITGGAVTGGLSAVGGALTSIPEVVSALWKDVNSVSFWVRIGLVIVGLGLFLIAARALVSK